MSQPVEHDTTSEISEAEPVLEPVRQLFILETRATLPPSWLDEDYLKRLLYEEDYITEELVRVVNFSIEDALRILISQSDHEDVQSVMDSLCPKGDASGQEPVNQTAPGETADELNQRIPEDATALTQSIDRVLRPSFDPEGDHSDCGAAEILQGLKFRLRRPIAVGLASNRGDVIPVDLSTGRTIAAAATVWTKGSVLMGEGKLLEDSHILPEKDFLVLVIPCASIRVVLP